jgi:PAS domain S-box-containing protein
MPSNKLHTRLVDGHPSEDPFAAAFKATRMPMIITDPRQHDNPIIFCNKAFNDLSGYSNDELIGRNCRMLQGKETDPATISKIRQAIASEESVAVDILNYRKDGTTFWNALFVSPVRDASGEVIYFLLHSLISPISRARRRSWPAPAIRRNRKSKTAHAI